MSESYQAISSEVTFPEGKKSTQPYVEYTVTGTFC